MESRASTPPIVLIHGRWLTPRGWEGWKERFESRGHQALAPAWPRMEGEVEHEVADYALDRATGQAGAPGQPKQPASI